MFKHILLPLDGSILAECVLPHALALAKVFESHITLLRVLEKPSKAGHSQPIDPLDWLTRKIDVEAYLEKVAGRLRNTGLPVECTLLEGPPANSIIDFAYGHNIDLIILSSHGLSGLSGWNVNSIVTKIILRARLSTMIVRAYKSRPKHLTDLSYKRLLVPLDGSQRAECALQSASKLAQFYNAQLLLAHVVCKPEMPRRTPLTNEDVELVNRIVERNQKEMEKQLEQLQSRLPVEVLPRLCTGEEIVTNLHDLVEKEEADLVVLSAHGYSGNTNWPYGSVTTSFIEYGNTALLIVQDLQQDELKPTEAEKASRESKGH